MVKRIFCVTIVMVMVAVLDYTNGLPSETNKRQSRSGRSYCNCECGIYKRQSRVVGGNITKINEFPWLVGVSHGGEFHCGAALISKRHILTAAHCVNGFNRRDLMVTLGDHDRRATDRFNHIEVRGIKTVLMHEHFDINNYNNDIAILEMDSPVSFSEKMNPVCLPSGGYTNYAGRVGIVAGWGRINEKGDTTDVLRKIQVPVWTTDECHNSGYGEAKISGNMFCAGYPAGLIDSCQGDSGGPLQIGNKNGRMEVIGVVSWGRGCARPNLPGVYTKVDNYLHWIEEHLQGECACQRNSAKLF